MTHLSLAKTSTENATPESARSPAARAGQRDRLTGPRAASSPPGRNAGLGQRPGADSHSAQASHQAQGTPPKRRGHPPAAHRSGHAPPHAPAHNGHAAPNASVCGAQRVPKLRHQKATGQAYVVIARKARYLGRFDDPDTAQCYHQLIAEWLAAGRQLRVDQDQITIKEVAARFWEHVEAYYRSPRGQPTSEVAAYKASLHFLKQLYANTPAAEFGPLKLKAVGEQMIAAGWCRRTVNKRVTRVKNLFRWATENELIGGEVLHALQAVAGLRQGRSACPETEPVRPVPLAWVRAIKPHVSRQVWAMVEFQLLTAARPGEVVVMRPCDLDTSGRVWTYTPAEHKNAYRGQPRTIYIGPRAQRLIKPFMACAVDAYLFSPADAERERHAAQHTRRKTPLAWGNRPGTNRADRPQRPAGDHYTVASYRRAIVRGSAFAFPLPQTDAADPKSQRMRLLRVRTRDRREKEKAMHGRFIDRFEAGLTKLQKSAERGVLRDLATANQRLGRLKERCWRAAAAFEVKIAALVQPTGKARLSITWTRNERWQEWSAISEGCYLLRTNLSETDPAVLWKRYIQLTEAEWAFRITKDELKIRPIWHRKEDRVKAHILICFLAYVLWKTLAQWMRGSGLGDAPRTLIEEFAKIKSGDVVLKARRGDDREHAIRVRSVTTADKAQKVLLNRLGLTLPQRLRYFDEVLQM